VEDFLLQYLIIPIMTGKLRKRDWISLIEKIERGLDGGKAILLSPGGRRTLLNLPCPCPHSISYLIMNCQDG